MPELPWFPFYVDDFMGSRKVQRMSAESVGVYQLLLCEQWRNGPLPDDDGELAFLARAQIEVVRDVLVACFTLSPDGWANARLEKIRTEQTTKHKRAVHAGKLGAQARATKRLSSTASAPLEQPSSIRVDKTRRETTTTDDKSSGASPDVDNSESEKSDELRGEFAQLVRKRLWQSKDPPSKAWTMGREFNIRDMLIERGETPETINGVYARYRGEPATGKIYYARNSRPRWETDKSEFFKAQTVRVSKSLPTVGDVLSEMQNAS